MQKSIFWETVTATGDGAAAYTQEELFAWIKRTFGDGVILDYADSLAVTAGTLSVDVATGAAVVNGAPYENTAVVNLAVPHPTTGTTAHAVILRWSDTAHTVRITLLSASDGVSTPPTLTTTGGVYEVLLANVLITTGNVITVTNLQEFIGQQQRSFFVPVNAGEEVLSGDSIPLRQLGIELSPALDTQAYAVFTCPLDYLSDLNVRPVVVPSSSGDVRVSHGYFYGFYNQAWNTYGTVSPDTTVPMVAGITTELNIALSPELAEDMAAGAYIVGTVVRTPGHVADVNPDSLLCLGFLVSYRARS